MKGAAILALLLVALVASEDELQLADVCDPEACQLPDCRCSTTEIPGGLEARDTPQFVLLTFDDAVNVINIETYRSTIFNRRNQNSCPAGVTFYINHEYTDYQIVNELYNQGFEIALHSVSHMTNQTYWQEATYDEMAREFGDQVIQMAHFANIPSESIKGVRIPFLQMTGNASFQVMADFNLEYDCTWPTVTHFNPGLWPYTLDYASTQDCIIPPCPTASIPGPWVLPMVTWRDLTGTPCSMVDSCSAVPSTEDEWFQFILTNFERHYTGNRAPFGFYIHEWYIRENVNPHVGRALVRFLDLINNLNDVFMFVLLTFDDAVNVINIETYRSTIFNRRNQNSCPAGVTFYINHEYTDYQIVNELYNQGFEIALHSVSHMTNQTYWQEATYDEMAREFGDQVIQMAHFANIPSESIKGVRIPFLQMTGNASFQVMADFNLEYDCTWPTVTHFNPGLWPYTLDYASTQDCIIPPCPTASIPGPWVLPMVTWRDLTGTPCSMVDSCSAVPSTEDEWFQFILTNFERHYTGNRAPFGFYIHEWYIRENVNPHVGRALVRFLDLINNLNDVFMVNSREVIDWVKNPVPLNEYVQQPCNTHVPTICPAASCPVVSDHNQNTYWMSICNVCPRVYPWLGNPLGL